MSEFGTEAEIFHWLTNVVLPQTYPGLSDGGVSLPPSSQSWRQAYFAGGDVWPSPRIAQDPVEDWIALVAAIGDALQPARAWAKDILRRVVGGDPGSAMLLAAECGCRRLAMELSLPGQMFANRVSESVNFTNSAWRAALGRRVLTAEWLMTRLRERIQQMYEEEQTVLRQERLISFLNTGSRSLFFDACCRGNYAGARWSLEAFQFLAKFGTDLNSQAFGGLAEFGPPESIDWFCDATGTSRADEVMVGDAMMTPNPNPRNGFARACRRGRIATAERILAKYALESGSHVVCETVLALVATDNPKMLIWIADRLKLTRETFGLRHAQLALCTGCRSAEISTLVWIANKFDLRSSVDVSWDAFRAFRTACMCNRPDVANWFAQRYEFWSDEEEGAPPQKKRKTDRSSESMLSARKKTAIKVAYQDAQKLERTEILGWLMRRYGSVLTERST